MGAMGTWEDTLTEEQKGRLRAWCKAQADAAPPITAEQFTEIYQLLWQGSDSHESAHDAQPSPA